MTDSGHQPTILIVEDLDWIRSGMRRALEREGYYVAEARNDAEAFAFSELKSVDLILTEEDVATFEDLMARRVDHPSLSSVPVVIINPDCEDGARYGDAYILRDFADISSFLAVEHR